MPFLVLALVLLFLIPWLGLLLFAFFLFFLVLIPLGFAARSFVWLILGPRELFRILVDRDVRRNHALEHATIHVLESRLGPMPVTGMAYRNGFSIGAPINPKMALDAAKEGLARLQGGERRLAVHPRCGTTVVVTNTLSALLFILLLFLTGNLNILTVIVALLAAHLLGPLSSRYVQEYVTTATDVENLRVTGVETRSRPASIMGMRVVLPAELFIYTSPSKGETVVEVLD